MTATPLLPGRAYRITACGYSFAVIAAHPCEALCIALDLIGVMA